MIIIPSRKHVDYFVHPRLPSRPPSPAQHTFRVQRIHGAASPLLCPGSRSSGGWWRSPGRRRRRWRGAAGGTPWGRGRRGVVHPRHSGHGGPGHAVHPCGEGRRGRRMGAAYSSQLHSFFGRCTNGRSSVQRSDTASSGRRRAVQQEKSNAALLL